METKKIYMVSVNDENHFFTNEEAANESKNFFDYVYGNDDITIKTIFPKENGYYIPDKLYVCASMEMVDDFNGDDITIEISDGNLIPLSEEYSRYEEDGYIVKENIVSFYFIIDTEDIENRYELEEYCRRTVEEKYNYYKEELSVFKIPKK